ncbi:MAG: alpha/beta hydrolase [Acidimicrobiaceae bacterium]|nr:alpha/beta hydrolase [Acidimicrobiaceae bacterium]
MSIWTDLIGVPFCLGPVDAGGTETRALVAGRESPDVVFLHGTSGHLEAFSRNLGPHVAAGYRCHAIDLLGHGYTAGPGHPYEILDYVEHLIAYLDAQQIATAHLVGESLGGWVAARAAVLFPERVASLQLVAAGGTKADPAVMRRIKESTTEAVLTDDPSLTRRRLELLMFDPADVSDELVAVRHRIYHQPSFQANLANLLCLQEMEVRTRNLLSTAELGRIACPTLVVWGTNNPFGAVPEASAMAAAIPGAALEVFPECGHWPQHEHAEEYNALSVAFLAKAEATRSTH